ncbi:Aste57867_13639 [Aphanomyces stellatus]|uniref:glutathione gamma-glutamylcysteinyltransferase n=1 Tax=Aphanomyces stellatus TaxID=120398 RepID=A0A485KYN9_9STRA|nr:hypothetical protein As57867_013589 [Aphanomyces stellatus]VFT90476.1 Aste57867_13639 [Aphanomyces stellatus]
MSLHIACSKRQELVKALALPKSFHQRPLPPLCIAFASVDGRKLFQEALSGSYMHIYFPLAEQFTTQTEPSFCGLTTLVMCLNALRMDPGRPWKSAWRWYSEEMLDCACASVAVVKEKGISLPEFVALAKCQGLVALETRATAALTLDVFRTVVRASCATSSEVLVVNYSRKTFEQTGDGHFSPIGGYNAASDMVLLMDVARFKYPPHWVSLPLLLQSMQQIDASSGLPRGYVLLKQGPTTLCMAPPDSNQAMER